MNKKLMNNIKKLPMVVIGISLFVYLLAGVAVFGKLIISDSLITFLVNMGAFIFALGCILAIIIYCTVFVVWLVKGIAAERKSKSNK